MSAVKEKNQKRKSMILSILFKEGEKSIAELTQLTNISLPVVTKLIGELKKDKFITENKELKAAQAGRPASFYKINGTAGYLLGVDLGRIHTTFIIIDLEQNIIYEKREKVTYLSEDEKVVSKIHNKIISLIDEAKLDWDRLMGVGFSIPGYVNSKLGLTESYLNFHDSIKLMLEKEIEKPILIEHDAKSMIYGELWFGAAKGLKNVLCINYGWGLGLGMLLDSKVFYGQDGYAGEFGHIPVTNQSHQCYCGKIGCLETVSSGKSIERITREKLSAGATSTLTLNNKKIESIEVVDILEAANKGDHFAIEIMQEAGFNLGYGIASLINIFNPQKIIISGSISKVADYILDSVRSSAMKHSLVKLNKNIEFEISKLGYRSAALGVARLVANEII